jgi:hypothetical protein
MMESAVAFGKDIAEEATNMFSDLTNSIGSFFGSWGRSKEGSITHYTGPMWIDGTPSRPEMVLNPD